MGMTSLHTQQSVPLMADAPGQSFATLSALPVPKAILLDFGGVIFETSKHPDGRDRLAALYQQRLQDAGMEFSVERLRHSIDAGLTALKAWKNASSRRLAPRELTHREVITDFMVSDLPAGARELLASHAPDLLVQQNRLISDHHLRPGIAELITVAQRANIPLGIVSNAHAGASHRQLLDEHHLGDVFAVQIYSDEVGIRKPHPEMLQLAADALNVEPSQCWYVGDTQDRDVVAGRRANVGAVLLTRCHHTDTPPFAVSERADMVFETPRGLIELLEDTLAAPEPQDALPATDTPHQTNRWTLLIDHGGVISTSVQDLQQQQDFQTKLARLLEPVAGEQDPAQLARTIMTSALADHKQRKAQRHQLGDHTEVTPQEFWSVPDAVGVTAAVRARLRSECSGLMAAWGQAKSRRTIRTGVVELMQWCAQHGHRIVVVTNTVSGTAVRSQLEDHGIAQYITAVVASDEFGKRKPDPSIVQAALDIAGADPQRTVFLGDKPDTDGRSATACNIAYRVLVRGGSTAEPALQTALADNLATHLVDEPGDVLSLMQSATRLTH